MAPLTSRPRRHSPTSRSARRSRSAGCGAREPERLRYLASVGLVPGVVVTLLDHQPFGGPVTVEAGGERHVIGEELAQVVLCASERGR